MSSFGQSRVQTETVWKEVSGIPIERYSLGACVLPWAICEESKPLA